MFCVGNFGNFDHSVYRVPVEASLWLVVSGCDLAGWSGGVPDRCQLDAFVNGQSARPIVSHKICLNSEIIEEEIVV
jgi:hypothetical protein